MKIQILGSGCPRCRKLEEYARAAVADLDIEAAIEKVTDFDRIMNIGVMFTPPLVVNEQVKSAGKVLAREQIAQILYNLYNIWEVSFGWFTIYNCFDGRGAAEFRCHY